MYQIDDAGAVVGPLGTGGGGNDATITSTDHYGGASSSDGIALATWLQYRDLKCEINGTAARVNASASFPQRVAVAGKLRAVADATTATTTLSGTAGARYIMADVSATATTFTLTNDTDNTPTATEKLVGVAYWDGAAITHTFTVGQHGNYEIIVTSTQITTTLGTYQDAGTVLTFVSDGITPSRLESQLLVSANYTSGTADNCFWALNVDSTVRQEVACVVYSAPAAERQSFNLAWEAGILSAGVHTAKIQQKASHTGLTAAVDGHVLPGKLWVVQVA